MSGSTQTTVNRQGAAWAHYAVVAVAWLFVAGGIMQIFLAGLSVFDSPTYWTDHVNFGRGLSILALLLPIMALIGRTGRGLIIQSSAVFILYMLQSMLANLDVGVVAALHAVTGFILVWLASRIGVEALNLMRSRD